mmetsp:Transcript_20008/g.28738  ORF Transcript_20008/g.28738 Transcript_20008/m.28738 type:complete len:127 (-) Transcript_20008:53-433(-)
MLDQLGIMLPVEMQKDSGVLVSERTKRPLSNNPSVVNRRRQRMRRAECPRSTDSTTISDQGGSNSITNSFVKNMLDTFQRQHERKLLECLYLYGTDKMKAKAQERLLQLGYVKGVELNFDFEHERL